MNNSDNIVFFEDDDKAVIHFSTHTSRIIVFTGHISYRNILLWYKENKPGSFPPRLEMLSIVSLEELGLFKEMTKKARLAVGGNPDIFTEIYLKEKDYD